MIPASALMDAVRSGPSHPLAIGATALLILNDHALKQAYPGLLTGKLSDFAFLVVAPVALAALLAMIGVGERKARWIALLSAGVAFVVLQIWPPLGEAWVALFGGSHTADIGDLLALPALLGAWFVWRNPPARRLPIMLPVSAAACLATTEVRCDDARLPADGAEGWDPSRPLALGYGNDNQNSETPGLLSGIRLADARGVEVPLVAASSGNAVYLCPIGGLNPETDYVWSVREFEPVSANHLAPQEHVPGTWRFRTGPASGGRAARNEADCREIADARDGPLCLDTDVDTGAP